MPDKITPLHDIVQKSIHLVPAKDVIATFQKAVPKWSIECYDSEYACLPHSVWIQIIEQCPSRGLRYSLPTKDCNNYADVLKGWVKLEFWGVNGISWIGDFAGKHSFNCAVCYRDIGRRPDGTPLRKLDLLWIEPQRDLSFKLDSQPCYTSKGFGEVRL